MIVPHSHRHTLALTPSGRFSVLKAFWGTATVKNPQHVSTAAADTKESLAQRLRDHLVLGPWLTLLECVMGGGRPRVDCVFSASRR